MQLMFLYVYLMYAHFALFSYPHKLNHQSVNNEQFIIVFLTSAFELLFLSDGTHKGLSQCWKHAVTVRVRVPVFVLTGALPIFSIKNEVFSH